MRAFVASQDVEKVLRFVAFISLEHSFVPTTSIIAKLIDSCRGGGVYITPAHLHALKTKKFDF